MVSMHCQSQRETRNNCVVFVAKAAEALTTTLVKMLGNAVSLPATCELLNIKLALNYPNNNHYMLSCKHT